MSEKASNQASSQEDLDQLSALEESMAPFGMGDLDTDKRVDLKDWTAQDFANFYVHFRPHLENYARRYVHDRTQVDDVVQDAFLYLMTSLPELDSELGVLRFLKWKTRMLSLDLLRTHNRVRQHSEQIEDLDSLQFRAEEKKFDPSEDLIRAEDSAVVQLAFARLSERHQIALSLVHIQDVPQELAAETLGLEPGAFRQLLLRARRKFKEALVGDDSDLSLEGKELLSVSLRRSRVAQTSLVLLGLGPLILFSTLNVQVEENRLSPSSQSVTEELGEDTPRLLSMGWTEVATEETSDPSLTANQPSEDADDTIIALQEQNSDPTGASQEAVDSAERPPRDDLVSAEAGVFDPSEAQLMSSLFAEQINFGRQEGLLTGENVAGNPDATVIRLDGTAFQRLKFLVGSMEVVAVVGVNLHAADDAEIIYLQETWIQGSLNSSEILAAPLVSAVSTAKGPQGYFTAIAMTDFLVGDASGEFGSVTTNATDLSATLIDISFSIDESGQIVAESSRLSMSRYRAAGNT